MRPEGQKTEPWFEPGPLDPPARDVHHLLCAGGWRAWAPLCLSPPHCYPLRVLCGGQGTQRLMFTCVSLPAGPGLWNQVHGDKRKGQHQRGERESQARGTSPFGPGVRSHPPRRLCLRDWAQAPAASRLLTERFLSSTTCQAPCKAQAVWGDCPLVLTPVGASPSWVPRKRSHWLSGHAGEQARFCRWGDRDAESPPGWRPGSPPGSRFHSQRPPVQSRGPCPRLAPGRPSSPLHQPCSSLAFCSIPPLLKSFQNGSSTPLPTSATYKRHRKPSLAGPSQCVSPVTRASPTSL